MPFVLTDAVDMAHAGPTINVHVIVVLMVIQLGKELIVQKEVVPSKSTYLAFLPSLSSPVVPSPLDPPCQGLLEPITWCCCFPLPIYIHGIDTPNASTYQTPLDMGLLSSSRNQ